MATNEPNMNLILPTIGTDTGLTWEQSANANSTTIGAHTHAPGSGVQITPLGLNINTNLPFNGNQISTIYGIGFSSQAASAQLAFLYTNAQSGGGVIDLFYNDGAGNVIPLTKGGIVNSTASSIPGESFGSGTFVWKQGSGSTTPANFDIGSVTIRPNTAATTNGITLTTPAGISSLYTLVLPALPTVKSFATIDSSGNISSAVVGPTKTTGSSVAAGGVAISSSCGLFTTSTFSQVAVTNLSVTITTTGNPVSLSLIDDSSGGQSAIGLSATTLTCSGDLYFFRGATQLTQQGILSSGSASGASINMPGSSFSHTDFPSAGTYTYSVSCELNQGTAMLVQFLKLVAYEI